MLDTLTCFQALLSKIPVIAGLQPVLTAALAGPLLGERIDKRQWIGVALGWSGEFIFALAWLVVVLSLGAISLLYLLIRHGEVARVTSMFYLVPPVTAIMAFAIFGERLGIVALVGMALTVLGVALVVRR